jgi:hypothetical protein
MSMTMMKSVPQTPGIEYAYEGDGEICCRNPRGLVFFLRAEPPSVKPAESWTPVAATREVEVRRAAEPRAIAEVARPLPDPRATAWKPIEAKQEVEVRRVAEPQPQAKGTGPLPDAPAPGKAPEKGWFGKLFR